MRSNYVAAPESASSSLNLLTGSPYSQSGGKSKRRSKSMRRSKSKARRARRAGSSCSMKGGKRRGKARRARKAGGLINQAIVPFGLLAAQKKSQRRHKHSHGKKHLRKSFRKKR